MDSEVSWKSGSYAVARSESVPAANERSIAMIVPVGILVTPRARLFPATAGSLFGRFKVLQQVMHKPVYFVL